MKLRLNNDADVFAITQIASLQNPRSLVAIIGAYLTSSDIAINEIEVAKDLLPTTYRANPSLFASRVQAAVSTQFQSASGHQSSAKPTHITVKLHKSEKPLTYHPSTSIKSVTKQWLASPASPSQMPRLRIPLEGIPPFFQSHSEQFTYQIKQETNTRIKILKLKKSWIISRK